jgi:hypothetical protein
MVTAVIILIIGTLFCILALVLYGARQDSEASLDVRLRKALGNHEIIGLVMRLSDARVRMRSHEKRDIARYNLLRARLKEKVSDQDVLDVLHKIVERISNKK